MKLCGSDLTKAMRRKKNNLILIRCPFFNRAIKDNDKKLESFAPDNWLPAVKCQQMDGGKF